MPLPKVITGFRVSGVGAGLVSKQPVGCAQAKEFFAKGLALMAMTRCHREQSQKC